MQEEAPNNPQESKHRKFLEELSEQSWNPELIISGFALYATLQLPDWIEQLYYRYYFHFQTDSSAGNEYLPILISAVLMSITQILSIAFITHFILRAFWVGFLGVLSVYPKGIDFESISTYGDYGKNKLREKMENLDSLALKLERASSVVFALAIVVVLQLISVCLVYFSFALLHNGFQHLLGKEAYTQYENTLTIVLLAVLLLPSIALTILNLKFFKNHPTYSRWHYHTSESFKRLFLLLFAKHIQSLLLTFNSNVSKTRLTIAYTIVGLVFAILLTVNSLKLNGASPFLLQDFYTYRQDYSLTAAHYEDERSSSAPRVATIASAVVKEEYVRLFLAYPKRYDEYLRQLCPSSAKRDTLYEQRKQADAEKLACLEQFYEVKLNDSLLQKKDLMYYTFEDNGDKGLMMLLPRKDCQVGKNTLQIRLQGKEYTKKQRPYEALITFWR